MTHDETGSDLAADDVLLAALVAGRTSAQAATTANVSRATVSRRLTDPIFRQRLAALRHEILQQAVDLTSTLTVRALTYLGAVLIDENEPTRDRMAAAKAIIGVTVRVSGPDGGPVLIDSPDELRARATAEITAAAERLGLPRTPAEMN
jgi:tetrahydromethanopterin S-methyltransferase subunit E